MKTLNRIAKWVLWTGLVLFTLGVIVWTIAHSSASSKLEREIGELTRAGLPTQPIQLTPGKIAEDDNAAPLYLAAFALLPETPQIFDRDLESLKPEEKKELEAGLEKAADSFALAKRARDRKSCRFERTYGDGFNILLPDLAKAIRLAKFLRLRATLLPDSAPESVRDLFALAECYRDEPILVCQLVRLVIAGFALDAIDHAVTAETGEADLKAWLDLLPDPKRYDGMIELGFRGDLAATAGLLAGSITEIWNQVAHPANQDPELLRPLFGNVMLPILKSDGAHYLATMRRAIEIARKPYLQAKPEMVALLDEVERSSTFWHPVTRVMMPALNRCLDNHAHLLARLAVVRAGLECEIARTSGAYPEKLATPDPMNGKPLSYEKGQIRSAGLDQREIVWTLRHK